MAATAIDAFFPRKQLLYMVKLDGFRAGAEAIRAGNFINVVEPLWIAQKADCKFLTPTLSEVVLKVIVTRPVKT